MCPNHIREDLKIQRYPNKRAQYLQKKKKVFVFFVYHSDTPVSSHIAIMGRLSQNRGLCHDFICNGKT